MLTSTGRTKNSHRFRDTQTPLRAGAVRRTPGTVCRLRHLSNGPSTARAIKAWGLPCGLAQRRTCRAVPVFKIPSEPAQTCRLHGCLAHRASAASCLSIAKAMRVLAVSQATCAAARTRVAGGYVGGLLFWCLLFGQANKRHSRCSAKSGPKPFSKAFRLARSAQATAFQIKEIQSLPNTVSY